MAKTDERRPRTKRAAQTKENEVTATEQLETATQAPGLVDEPQPEAGLIDDIGDDILELPVLPLRYMPNNVGHSARIKNVGRDAWNRVELMNVEANTP